jgi:hypothetical protein
MSISIVDKFEQQPAVCMHCGSSGVNEEVDEPKIELVGIDINWGDTPYLCGECVKMICDLADRKTQREFNGLSQELQEARDTIEELEDKNETLQAKVDKILEGSRAKKELREAVSG